MKKLLVIGLLLASTSVHAQTSITAKDASGATQTFKTFNCASTICPLAVPTDTAGATLTGAAGSPSTSALTIQGIASGQPVVANMTQVAGSTLGALANYGTSPGAVLVQGVNAFVTNANANGQATMANSSPVVIASNQSNVPVNTAQVNGVTTLTGTGAVGTGAQRIAVGTDTATIAGSAPGTAGTASPNVVTVQGIASMTKLLVTPDSVALPANQSVNVSQINGVTPLMGNGTTGTGSPRVTVSSDNSAVAGFGVGATGSAPPANANYLGANVGGNLTGSIKCGSTATYDASTSGSTQLVALSSGKIIYICGYSIFAAGTVNVELDYGTGTACATSPTKIVPAYQLTAQTGIVDGSAEYRGLSTTASQELCIKTSAGVAVQAIVYYTQF